MAIESKLWEQIKKYLKKYWLYIKSKFHWHTRPTENDLILKSFFEFLFYAIITVALFALFYYWHKVPERNLVIVVDKVQGEKKSLKDTICKENANIYLRIPMTRLKSVGEKKYTINVVSKDFFSPKDSILGSSFDPPSFILPSIMDSLTQVFYDEIKTNNNKFLLNELREKFNNLNSKTVVYFALAYNRGPNAMYSKKDTSDRHSGTYSEYDFFSTPRDRSIYKAFISDQDINMYFIKSFNGDVLAEPAWYRFEDISQSYYNIRFNSNTFDSLTLKLDFVGVTEFSKMIPEPDFIDMNSIEFRNPDKIELIKMNGLKFHAEFKELENLQTIRLLAITTLLGGIIIIFAGIIFIGLYRYFFSWTCKHPKSSIAIIIIILLTAFYLFGYLVSIYNYFKYY